MQVVGVLILSKENNVPGFFNKLILQLGCLDPLWLHYVNVQMILFSSRSFKGYACDLLLLVTDKAKPRIDTNSVAHVEFGMPYVYF